MNKKVISSILSLAMCGSLVTGATYALFTSEAKTNIAITSGTVKVDASVDTTTARTKSWGNTYEDQLGLSPDASFSLAEDGTVLLNNILPGDGVEFDINVENTSTVAIQWRTAVTAVEGSLNGLKVTIEGKEFMGDSTAYSEWVSISAGEEVNGDGKITVAIELPADAGNELQGKTTKIAVAVNAAQGNADAPLASTERKVSNDEELAEVLANLDGVEIIYLAEGTYQSISLTGKKVNLIGSVDGEGNPTTKIYATTSAPNTSLSIPGVWAVYQGSVENVIFEAADGVANSENGALSLSSSDWGGYTDATFKNCRFINQGIKYAGNADFVDCVFDGQGKAARAFNYCVPAPGAEISLTNCKISGYTMDSFHIGENAGSAKFVNCDISGACMEFGNLAPSEITFVDCTLDCTVNLYIADVPVTFVDAIKGENFKLNNTVNATVEDIVTIASAEELRAFEKGVNENGNSYNGQIVKLVADIDLNNEAWTPVGQTGATQFHGTFDGNGKTISNLSVDSTSKTDAEKDKSYATGLFGWSQAKEIKNVIIDGATIKGSHNVGVIAGYAEGGGDIVNCTVKNATVTAPHVNEEICGDKIGGIVGQAQNVKTIVNCKVDTVTIIAGRDAGLIAGIVTKLEQMSGCSATNSTVTAKEHADCTGANIGVHANGLVGRI